MSSTHSRRFTLLAITLTTLTLGAPAWAWPDRPITMVVPWGAGGGTDQTARIIANGLEKHLGQPVNVVNRTGGNGLVGHQAIASAAPDGYTIGMATTELSMLRHQGVTDLGWQSYTPLALMNRDPAGVQVRADAPYQSVADLLAAAAASPGKLKASGTGSGGIWHLALAGLLVDRKLSASAVGWVPSNGAAPALQELVAGGVDVVTCSVPEARALIEAGKVRSLAIMADQPNPALPQVPTLKAAIGSDWGTESWRGVVAPKGLPADVSAKLIDALGQVYRSEDFVKFMAQRGFGTIHATGADFARYMEKKDADMGVAMKAAGVAK